MMRIAVSIQTEDDAIPNTGAPAPGHRICGPTIDLGKHGFHLGFALSIVRVPPIESAQRFIDRIVRLLRFCDDAQSELMHEPSFRARVTWRIDRFLTPLQKTLGVSERALFFRMTRGREKKNFRLDFFRL